MPNRIIREAILSSEKMALLGWPEEVFYRRLMSIVDDYGRYEANPQLLRSKCYPLQVDDVRVADITRWMAACQKAGLLLNYAVQGKQYLEVSNFGQQQRTVSKYPPATANDTARNHLLADAHLDVSVSEVVSEVVKAASPVFILPDWIPEDAWSGYLEMRKKKRVPMTNRALQLKVGELDVFRKQGHDVAAILNKSTSNAWTDVYAPKPEKVSQFPDKNAIPPVSTIWHESAAGVAQKAAELHLSPQGDTESHPAFKNRVQAVIGRELGFNQLAAMAQQRQAA